MGEATNRLPKRVGEQVLSSWLEAGSGPLLRDAALWDYLEMGNERNVIDTCKSQ